jgi:hypothetical protein
MRIPGVDPKKDLLLAEYEINKESDQQKSEVKPEKYVDFKLLQYTILPIISL